MESRLFFLFPDETNKLPLLTVRLFLLFRCYFVLNNVIIFPILRAIYERLQIYIDWKLSIRSKIAIRNWKCETFSNHSIFFRNKNVGYLKMSHCFGNHKVKTRSRKKNNQTNNRTLEFGLNRELNVKFVCVKNSSFQNNDESLELIRIGRSFNLKLSIHLKYLSVGTFYIDAMTTANQKSVKITKPKWNWISVFTI